MFDEKRVKIRLGLFHIFKLTLNHLYRKIMATKSIPQQIYDGFISEISKDKSISEELTESLRKLLETGNVQKRDIVEVLKKEGENNEDT